MPLSEPRLFLFTEEDRHAFFLVGGVLDIGALITMSVICIRAGAFPLPHYVAKLWANGPPGEPKGRTDAVKVEMEVTSSKDPADVDVQELTFLTVPPKLLAGAKLVNLNVEGHKLSPGQQLELTFLTVPPKLLAGAKLVSLHIQIDKLMS